MATTVADGAIKDHVAVHVHADPLFPNNDNPANNPDADVSTFAGVFVERDSDQWKGGWQDSAKGEEKGTMPVRFCFPNALAIGNGLLYVSDSDNRRIRVVDLATGRVSTHAGGGATGFVENRVYPYADGVGDAALFGEVRGCALDSKGNLFVADMFNHAIRMIAPDRTVSLYVGQAPLKDNTTGVPIEAPTRPPADDLFAEGDRLKECRLNRPAAVAVDKHDNLFLCDFSNNCIRRVDHSTGMVTTFSGCREKGYKDGQPQQAEFNWPNHICTDQTGTCLYVAEAESFIIRKVYPDGMVVTFAGVPNQHGHLDGPADRALFGGPNAVAVDPYGWVYVSEDENHCIRMISPKGVVGTLAGHKKGSKNQCAANEAEFAMPTGIAFDPERECLYVSDYGNHVIRKISKKAILAKKEAMNKVEGKFPQQMPEITEEKEDDEEAEGAAAPGAGATAGAVGGEEGSSDKPKKGSKSKKREKTTDEDLSANANGVETGAGAAAPSEEGAAAAAKPAQSSAADAPAATPKKEVPSEEDDPKSCRMCQNNGCSIM